MNSVNASSSIVSYEVCSLNLRRSPRATKKANASSLLIASILHIGVLHFLPDLKHLYI
jgi:hypothetical protein